MRDIRSFKSSKEKESLTQEKAVEMLDQFDEKTKSEADLIEESLRKYEGKTQRELMGELTRLAELERKKGVLNDAKLDDFARSVSPMLNQEQRRRLSGILKQLKK